MSARVATRFGEVLAGAVLPRLQIARSHPVVADVVLGGLPALAAAHRAACAALAEDLALRDDGVLEEVAVDAALIDLKAELASRWLDAHPRPIASGWLVEEGIREGVSALLLEAGEGMDPREAAATVTDGFDDGARLLAVQAPGPGALPGLLELLGRVEVAMPVVLCGPLDWPPVPLALATWLFDRVIIHGGPPDSPGRRLWPGMRAARFLARAGEEVSYRTGHPSPAGPWQRRLRRWAGRHGVGLEEQA